MKFPHNISRIEAFSDGVFAFAATLLVVSFDTDDNFRLTTTEATSFITFGVCFFVLAGLWSVHYHFFRRNKYMDNWIIAINVVLLFVILYYIFPLKSLIETWAQQEGISIKDFSSLFQLYSLGFLLIFLCYAIMYFRAYKKTRAIENSMTLLFYGRHFTIFVLVAGVSIVLARFHIGLKYALPGMIYFLLGPLCYTHGVYFEKKYNSKL